MNLFEIQGDIVAFAPEALIIPEFRKLWDKDKSKDKKQAIAELGYVYYMSDFKSIYNNYSENEKEQHILDDIMPKDWEPDKDTVRAMAKYQEIHVTHTMKIWQDAMGAVDKLRRYFREVDLTERDDKGKPVYHAKDLVNNLKQVGDLIKGLKALEEEIQKEQVENSRIKGGGQAGLFEDPDELRK